MCNEGIFNKALPPLTGNMTGVFVETDGAPGTGKSRCRPVSCRRDGTSCRVNNRSFGVWHSFAWQLPEAAFVMLPSTYRPF